MNDIEPGRHVLIASTGGHLAQLVKWSQVLHSREDSVWITFDNPQSRSLLADKSTVLVPYIPPRGLSRAAKALVHMQREVDWRKGGFSAAISTGAALAVPGLLLAHARGVPSHYIESVSRVNGPSLSGRILSSHPGINLSCQYRSWAGGKWQYRGTVLDRYARVRKSTVDDPQIFVTLGTIKPYRFDALVDGLLQSGLVNDRTVWQLGCTDRRDLPGNVYTEMSGADFDTAALSADLVVTHAGVGTILRLLDLGVYPVVVPRRKSHHEHVDNHQHEIADVVGEQAIGAVIPPDLITREAIIESTGFKIRSL
ncbi:glycosyltransferase [Rhodococcus ruber]|uniref:glycosyltransferase n=1 Tax=Rhodococcus ruber TaxID=1830 RepID=UPI000B15918A|nr:glycosyltransferase [Rhodococcus ruber]MDO1480751.1 glycosyl transferase [Rhodococcus ruber]